MADETGFIIGGDAIDRAAREEEAVAGGVSIVALHDLAAGPRDSLERRFLRSRSIVPLGSRMPRWSGRLGWQRSTIGRPRPARGTRPALMAAMTSGNAPLWSKCQCDRKTHSMVEEVDGEAPRVVELQTSG